MRTTACLPGRRWPQSPPAGASSGEALAAPLRSAAAARSARAHAHRVMIAHPVEVAARARRNREGSLSGSSFQGNHRVVGRLLRAESARLPVAIYSHSVTGPCPRSPGQDPPRTGRTQPGRRYAVPTLQARVPVVTSLIVILSALENSAASLGAGRMSGHRTIRVNHAMVSGGMRARPRRPRCPRRAVRRYRPIRRRSRRSVARPERRSGRRPPQSLSLAPIPPGGV